MMVPLLPFSLAGRGRRCITSHKPADRGIL